MIELRARLLLGLIDDRLHGPLAFAERGCVVPAVAHRVAVVHEHEVMRRAGPQQPQPLVSQHQVGQHQHQHGDGRHPRCEQEQLLEQDPPPVAPLALDRNCIAAQRIRCCRRRLIRWITIGTATSGKPIASNVGNRNDMSRTSGFPG